MSRLIAFKFGFDGGIFIRLPRRQAVGLDHHFSDPEINTPRCHEHAVRLLQLLRRKQSRDLAKLKKLLYRAGLAI